MALVFGIVGTGFFAPSFLEGPDGKLTAFQEQTLNSSAILIVVIISGAIAIIGLNKKGSQDPEIVGKLIASLDKIDPEIVKKIKDELS